MSIIASVLLTVRNVEKFIADCIKSLLDQTHKDFEIIIVDDCSNDHTRQEIETFNDKRIKYFRNRLWLGLSPSRNESLKYAKGEYVFFTDGDCTVSRNWIEEGLKCMKHSNYVGAEGKTYYVSEGYKPTRSDDVVENKNGGQFMTCNIVYRKSAINSVGGFDNRFTYMEDRDLAFGVAKLGKIIFNPKMVVYHKKKTLNPKQFVQTGRRLRSRVLLYKKFGDKTLFIWRIAYPANLIKMAFPFVIFGSFFKNRYKTKEDFNLFPYIYIRLIYERLCFWDMCARERVFLI
jgi:glycosyltransferase involved in cell wall biosynthesis